MWWLFLLGFTLVYGIIWPCSLYQVYQTGRQNLPFQARLPDVFHAWLPELEPSWMSSLGDLFAYTMCFLPLCLGWNELWFYDYLMYMLTLQTLRCVCFNVTILPDASQRAHLKPYWKRYLFGGVYDLVFSGHLAYCYAPALFLYRRGVLSAFAWHSIWMLFVVSSLQILATRSHYTIDLIVAVACCHWVHDWYW